MATSNYTPISTTLTDVTGWVTEWGMVLLFSVIVIGSGLLGARHLGSGGMWIGGFGGFLVSVVVVWLWARWSTSR